MKLWNAIELRDQNRPRPRVVPKLRMTARPFRVLGVQQVAIGAAQKSELLHLWTELLGVSVVSTFRSERENVDEDILQLGAGVLAVELDLMQPLRPDDRPKVHEPALNHIGLWIDDLAAAHRWLVAAGVRFAHGGIRKGAAGHDICFIHPKPSSEHPESGVGVLIELVQAPPEVIAEYARLRAGA